jgi:glycosyltransferase involved in cell wall biosynthesis
MNAAQAPSVFGLLRDSRLSVIVPVYNEGEGLAARLDLLLRNLDPYFSQFEVLVISDGSTDTTNLQLHNYKHPKVKPIVLERNQGKGYVIRRGFQEATGDYVLFIDGGMELHPREIRIFLGLLVLYEADIVLGSKRHPQSQVDYPRLRVFLSFIYQQIIRWFFDVNVTDTQVGLKIFRREVVEAVRPQLTIDRYGFDLEILALAKRKGFSRFLEAPVTLNYFHKARKERGFLAECLHVFTVGMHVFWDTVKVYAKIRRIRP